MHIEQGEKVEISREQLFVKLFLFKDKQNILRKAKLLKGTNIFINEDYCQDTVEYRKELWEEVKSSLVKVYSFPQKLKFVSIRVVLFFAS